MAKNLKKKILIGSILFGTSAGTLIGSSIAYHYVKQANSNNIDAVIAKVKKFKLELNPNYNNFDISKKYASEFAYQSFFGRSIDTEKEPTAKINTSYWSALENKSAGNVKIPFILLNRNVNYSLEDFKKNYFIYYHSFANDFTGELYLRIYFEKKPASSASPVGSTSEYNERSKNWVWVDFKLENFKKFDIQKNEDLLLKNNYAPSQHGFRLSTTTRNKLLKGEINSLDDIFDLTGNDSSKIPTKKQDSAESIKKVHSTFSSFLSYSSSSKKTAEEHAFKFLIDTDKPVWVSKDASSWNIHYYAYVFIPEAQYSDDKDLNSSKKVYISKEITTPLQIEYNNMKSIVQYITIAPAVHSKNKLNEILPSSLEYARYSSGLADYLNSSNGYIKGLNLFVKDDAPENVKKDFKTGKYTLSYLQVEEESGIIKQLKEFEAYYKDEANKAQIEKNSRTPFIKLNDKEGSAVIAIKISIKLENGYTESYISYINVTGMKTM
ncbi:MAG1430 family protein [Mycoplasmopsis primatum]|uniref:MAG1430 family protein n=1 Tax=Mycoplasmopsis primatum TaxID=55604 RepID=UPI0004955B79|nr:hypothetical protein [Mycoplasmopsis primatum]